jgi:hypothetical protein
MREPLHLACKRESIHHSPCTAADGPTIRLAKTRREPASLARCPNWATVRAQTPLS